MDQYIGKLLDNRYEIIERIGVGGMAMVYKARCHRLNRLVAIKILRDELAQDAEFRRRFHDESKAVAQLSHSNIVAVYDVSRSSESEYIVMELIDGITLKQHIKKNGNILNWREALHFIIQITKALGHAHSRGIIHRDIKPHNIMVLKDGSVKVADFGIARLMGGGNSTLTQEALGSVHYISPEQAKGSNIDERSDLYSTGVVLYEMITGRLPFEGDNAVSVAIQHINSIPLSPREINESLPEALEEITMRAMEPNLDNRFRSADEMLESLEEFRKNPEINFDYKKVPPPPPKEDNLDPGAVTQVIAPQVSRTPKEPVPHEKRTTPPPQRRTRSDYREPARKSNLPWGILVGVFVIFSFIGGSMYFLYQTFFAPLDVIVVEYSIPSVVGQHYPDLKLDTSHQFEIVLGDTITDDLPEGTILSQDPPAYTKTTNATELIRVVISGGPEVIEMINIKNQEYFKAKVELQNMGLDVAEPTYEYHDEIAYNYVISFTPTEKTQLKAGDIVQLVLSLGPETRKVSVPSLVGENRSQAENKLDLMNLIPVIKEEYSSTIPVGQVMDQHPDKGVEVAEGTEVNLQISLGPDPNTIPELVTKMVTVKLPETAQTIGAIIQIQVIMDDKIIYISDVDPVVTTSVSFDVEGNGQKELYIYFNGIPEGSQTVDFDS